VLLFEEVCLMQYRCLYFQVILHQLMILAEIPSMPLTGVFCQMYSPLPEGMRRAARACGSPMLPVPGG